MMIRVIQSVGLPLLSLFVAVSGFAGTTFVTMGTAGQTGVYYAVGNSVCRMVNKETKNHGVRCTAESTGGSIYNLNAMAKRPNPELDFAIVQSDWQFHAFKGTKVFRKSGSNQDLRSVFALHAEPFTVLARKDSGIKKLDDLVGKRINIGNPGSGPRGTFEVIMALKGWTKKSFKYVSELKSNENGPALCDNKVDAVLYTMGHPNGAVQETTTTCDALLVDVDGSDIDRLIAQNPYYAKAMIPGGLYRGNTKPIETFGVKATLVSSQRVSSEVVHTLVKTIFDNFTLFRKLHPAISQLDPKMMVRAGNSAPLHDGAKKYFKTKGWL